MKSQQTNIINTKKNVNIKKTVIFSELLVLFFILGSSMAMADTGFSEQNESIEVHNDVVEQTTSNPELRMAPENPEFIEYQREISTQTAESIDGYTPGFIPAPLDLSYLSEASDVVYSDAPANYDLRTMNKLTSVKDQGSSGSCWAFATYSSLESYLKPGETLDFSENNVKNLLSSSYPEGFDRSHDAGGNNFMSTAYLARWSGSVAESDDPYNAISGTSPQDKTRQKHTQDVLFLSNRQGPLDNEEIKWAVQNYGAVFTAMYYNGAYYSPGTYSYYYSGTANTNHAVAIVGWDDSYDRNKFSPVAPGNGAFIIKNSWGPSWGENGYFYISYYDSKLGTSNSNSVFTAESPNNYNSVYQYDPLGWVTSYGCSSPTAWSANIFTAKSDDVLKAVGFYTTDANCNYEIKIYTNPGSGPISTAGPVLTQSGVSSTAGYHTVSLNSGVPLTVGQKFSIVIKFTTTGYTYPLAVEVPISGYSSKARANASESFMSPNGVTWTAMTSVSQNMNACIKAFTGADTIIRPVANFSSNVTTGYGPLTVQFNDSSKNATGWSWNFGDGNTSIQQHPVHTFVTAKTYTVNLTASNENGTNSKLATITVKPTIPAANFSINVTSGYVPLTVQFTDLSQNATGWKWEFGDGSVFHGKSPAPHTYITAKAYTAKLTVNNSYGTGSKTATITVKPQVLGVNFTTNVSQGYAPLTVNFTDKSNSNVTGWKWEFGDGNISYGKFPAPHTYYTAKTYTAKLTVNDTYGSTESKTASIIAKPIIPVANFSTNVTSGYPPLTVNFTDLSQNATGWKWEFGDGAIFYGQSPAPHTYITPKAYTAKLTVNNSYGTGSKTATITVKPQVLGVNFTTNVSQGPAPLTVNFTDKSNSNVTGWKWEFGDGNISYGKFPAPHTYSAVKTYTSKLTVNDTYGSTESKTATITVKPIIPVANFSTNVTSGYPPLTVNFTDLSQNATGWKWEFGDGSVFYGQSPAPHTYITAKAYTAKLTVNNSYGTGSKTATITVKPQVLGVNFTTNVSQGYAPLTVNFTDKSNSNVTGWKWEFGDGNISYVKSPAPHTYYTAKTYTAKLTVNDTYGSTESKTATITAKPIIPVANFSTNVTSGYPPLTVQFTDLSQNATGWKWEFGDGAIFYGQSPAPHTYITPKAYTAKLTVNNSYGTGSKTATITVKPQVLGVNFTTNVNQGPAPLTVSFTDQSNSNVTGWKWEFGDGNISYGKYPVPHTYYTVKTYTAKLTVNDTYGSTESKTATIRAT